MVKFVETAKETARVIIFIALRIDIWFIALTPNNKGELAQVQYPIFLNFYLDMINKELCKLGKNTKKEIE